LADYFEAALKSCHSPKKLANWIMTELLREMSGEVGPWITSCKVVPESLGGLIDLVETGKISGKIAKTVFMEMMKTGKKSSDIVKEKNLVQVSDQNELLTLVKEIIAGNPVQAEEFKGGKIKLMGFFVGQLMQKTKGKANPQVANDLFSKELSG
jgi:aspartyl-tRNA(Asn)/glutamyl-tRNA(Gln) amidotransferase subunit B